MALTGDEGARRRLPTLPVTEIEAPSPSIFRDIDTPDALT
jgi:CTP:molybdopterin cytidylyltransferase MocA